MVKPKTKLGKKRTQEAQKRYQSPYLPLCSKRKKIINSIIEAKERRGKK